MRLVFVLCLVFICLQTKSQKIYGHISSAQKETLPYVGIRILNTEKGTLTDSLGNYSISLQKGRYTIQISSLGYATQLYSIEFGELDIELNFILEPIAQSLEEIVVTANKAEENPNQIPGSITVLSAEKLRLSRTWHLDDLRGLVPNYQYANLGVSYQQIQSIRGVSVFSETPSVSTYIDGVSALDISANGLQMADIERIEVLRGPQGTLFGRSSMGGVIQIFTKKPSINPSGFVEISLGNLGLERYSLGYKTHIIKNKLFIGINGMFEKQNGFYTNDLSDKRSFEGVSLKGSPEDGKRMGDQQSYFGNLHLKWLLNSKTELNLNVKAQFDNSIGASLYYQAVENEVIAIERPFKMAVNSLGSNARKIINNSISLSHHGSKFKLISISSYQHILQYYSHIDQDLFPYDLGTGYTYHKKPGDPIPQKVFSQELRFSSPNQSGKLNWIAGAFGFFQQYDKRYATKYEKLALFFGEKPGWQISQNDEKNWGLALFGQATYSFSKKWEVTFGLRYDYENRNSTLAKFELDSLGSRTYINPEKNRSIGFSAVSPKLAISLKPIDNSTAFVSFTRGFRAGGNNISNKTDGIESYKPEFSNNAELGYKFLSKNRKWQVKATGFFLYWQDLQLDYRTESGGYVIKNIGDVQAYGLELELNSKVWRNLGFDLSLGLNHSRYQDFEFLNESIKGNKTILAPPVTCFSGLQYLFPIYKKWGLLTRMEWRYIGNQYFDLINTIEQKGYSLFNSRIELNFKSTRIGFWGQNIFNKTYIAYAMPGYFRYTLLNQPRTWGITLSISF
jgi:iron complex outermembrane receptor protein